MKTLSKPEYLKSIADTRDARMKWWREARFGLFIHYGLYSQIGRGEWAMASECWSVADYEKLADTFSPRPDAAEQWAELAKSSGMKYAVLTTRHHEGFSLWDSKVNPFNSVNYGPKRDIVREFVDACRKIDIKVGLYSSIMDWRHPDGGACAYDMEARRRYLAYIHALNEELLSNYGKIDILWYDAAFPMEHEEGWDALNLNQRMRELQPDIIINDRSFLPEDFGTPEGHLTPKEPGRDWEACMTFNNISWGYIDSAQAETYSYNAHRALMMLGMVSMNGGNLLLNVGPAPDGGIPDEVKRPLADVGRWLERNGEVHYGLLTRNNYYTSNIMGLATVKGNTVYLVNGIWSGRGQTTVTGFKTKLKSARFVDGGQPIEFEQTGRMIVLKNLPAEPPDKILGMTAFALEFEDVPEHNAFPTTPAMNNGRIFEN